MIALSNEMAVSAWLSEHGREVKARHEIHSNWVEHCPMQYIVIKTEPQVRFASCIKSVQHLGFACAP